MYRIPFLKRFVAIFDTSSVARSHPAFVGIFLLDFDPGRFFNFVEEEAEGGPATLIPKGGARRVGREGLPHDDWTYGRAESR